MTSGADGDNLTTPNTVLVHEHESATLPAAKKQKQEGAIVAQAATSSSDPKRSFKAVANLVLAMKRFQCTLSSQTRLHLLELHSFLKVTMWVNF